MKLAQLAGLQQVLIEGAGFLVFATGAAARQAEFRWAKVWAEKMAWSTATKLQDGQVMLAALAASSAAPRAALGSPSPWRAVRASMTGSMSVCESSKCKRESQHTLNGS